MAEAITTVTEPVTEPSKEALSDNKLTSQAEETCSRSKLKSKARIPLKSQKSTSTSRRRTRYRLKRTLKRKSRFEDFQDQDVKYAYGSLKLQGQDIDPEVFQEKSLEYIYSHYDHVWTLKAKTSRGFIPVGYLYGVECNEFIHIIEVDWMEWASLRNKLETLLKFISVMRWKRVFTVQVPHSEIKFMERLCHYGMLHRSGTLEDIYDEKAPLFQTRLKRNGIT